MKKYNIFNYIRHKEDIKACMPMDKNFQDYTRNELIIKFMPLVETMARKFSTSSQASGILTINDLLQIGYEGLTKAVDRLDWEKLKDEKGNFKSQEDIETTLKSFVHSVIAIPIRHINIKPNAIVCCVVKSIIYIFCD